MNKGHRRTLTKVSNAILTSLTDNGNNWATLFYKLIVLLKKTIHENCHGKKCFGGALTFDAVYIYKKQQQKTDW